MKNSIIIILFVAIAVNFLAGCQSGSEPGGQVDDDPQGISDNRIEGIVHLYDEYKNYVVDRSEVMVTATNSSGVSYESTTNSEGEYAIEDVPSGIYTVTAAHTDYSQLYEAARSTRVGVQYVGADVLQVAKLTLAKELSTEIMRDQRMDSINLRITDLSRDGVEKYDTTANSYFSLDWQHTDGEIWPYVTISEDSTIDCGGELFKLNHLGRPIVTSGRFHYISGNIFKNLKEIYGDDVYGRIFYAIVRLRSAERPDPISEPEIQCGVKKSIPFVLQRP